MSDTPNPLWQVGASVFDGCGKELKIAKVRKNGNIALKGNPQQYRPYQTHASATGNSWSVKAVYADTPENRAKAERVVALAKAQNIVRIEAERIANLWREGSRSHDAIIAEAARISARKVQP